MSEATRSVCALWTGLVLSVAASGQSISPASLGQAKNGLHEAVGAGEVAGGAYMVVWDGEVVCFEVAGVRDMDGREPFKADTITRIYSMTKPITSVAAMTLYEQGRFQLDDPVAKYIPAFAETTVMRGLRTVPAKRQITVRDVFRHTTGYSYGKGKKANADYKREGLLYQPPLGMMPPDMSIEQAVEAMARIPALHHPGERFTYGFSTDLLGRLIEIWSGKSLDVYMRESVFEPLEMADTGLSIPPDRRDRFASCHTWREGKLVVVDKAGESPFNEGFSFLSGGGGLVSTIQDYANFCRMLVDAGIFKGRRILEEETVKLMFTDQLNGVAGGFRFGLGFAISQVKLGTGGDARMARQYAWGGYASTEFRLVPEEKLFQIFIRQRVPSDPGLANKLFGIVYKGVQTRGSASASDSATSHRRRPMSSKLHVNDAAPKNEASAAAHESIHPAWSRNWPQFRGPGALGVSTNTGLPDKWSATEHVVWKTPIPGRGWSSPVVWGNRIFITTAIKEGELEAVKGGLYFGGNRPAPKEAHRWIIYGLDLDSGKIAWEKEVHRGVAKYGHHVKGSMASETAVCDAERVYAYIGNVGMFCFDHDGRALWEKRWKSVPTRFGWGTAASPVLHGERVYVVNDNDEQSFLVALDRTTGEWIWRADRDEKSNWATPFVWENEKRTEIVTPGTGKIRSYALDGTLLWELGGMSSITIPTPFAGHGLLYVTSGYVGDKRRPLFAIRPGATGDITLGADETRNEHVAWCLKQAGPYNVSPILYGNHVYVLHDRGLLACYDGKTGTEVYGKRRIAPGARAFTSSPWAYDGKVFCLSEKGDTYVVRAGPAFELLGKNSLGELCMATPAIVSDGLIIRTESHILRIQ